MADRPTVVLGVSGSIAAYKAPIVARGLAAVGYRVVPMMTRSAAHFLGAATLAGITGERVRETMFFSGAPAPFFSGTSAPFSSGTPAPFSSGTPAPGHDGSGGEPHVELGKLAAAVVLVPATADLIARLAHGRADDIVTATALCTRAPVLVVPAMHPTMWSHPATRRNVATLAGDGLIFVGPVDGPVASGDSGIGRMSEPDDVVRAVVYAIARAETAALPPVGA